MWETSSVYSVKSELGKQKSNTGNSQKQENYQLENKEIRQGNYLKRNKGKMEKIRRKSGEWRYGNEKKLKLITWQITGNLIKEEMNYGLN